MKRLVLASAVVIAMVSVAPAYASLAVPEPSSSAQLIVGLLALGGLALFARKRASTHEAK
jgi:MYXO-CTERM domain-containing protein